MAAATGCDIHATSPRDTFTGVAARSVPVTRTHAHPLPTPPNSISPALPPHGLTAQLHKAAKLESIDSDLDLQDMDGGAGGGPVSRLSGVAALVAAAASTRGGSPPYESADAITPVLLAKYHLPEILLNHGPLAIRYIIGHLTAAVPGFSFIPPAKSRRLVVAALEGRGNGGEGGVGGLEGDVEFEKVSWGVWGARRVGGVRPRQRLPTPPPQSGIPIGSGTGKVGGTGRSRQSSQGLEGAFHPGDSDDVSMMDEEVDNMSMDDDGDDGASASCSEAPDDDVTMNDDPDNLTDDEDWGAVGAAALRAASYSHSATAGRFGSRFVSSQPFASFSLADVNEKQRSFSYSAAVDGAARTQRLFIALNGVKTIPDASEEQERDAVEALLRLGSV